MIDDTQFKKFADEVANKYPNFALSSAYKGFEEMNDFLLGKVPEYPEETLGRIEPPDGVSWLKTDKQKAWFFAAIRDGDIKGWKWVDPVYGESLRRVRTGKHGSYVMKG